MADSKKKNPPTRKPAAQKRMDEINDLSKRTKVIYSVNRKYKSQLVEQEEGGWMCQIWSIDAGGRERPVLRNVQPFATLEEAVQMAQECFARYTGDDRYFAKENILGEKKAD